MKDFGQIDETEHRDHSFNFITRLFGSPERIQPMVFLGRGWT